MRIGINGFGRIGRNFTKAIVERHPEIEIAAVNDLIDAKECAHLFKYDSNYGIYDGSVSAGDGTLSIDRQRIKVFAERDPGKLPWRDLGVDIVIESTGLFTDAAKARAHIDSGGAKKVLISAPAKGEDITIVLGVNERRYDPQKHHVISNASCTTNCLATAVKPIVDELGWVKGFMTTIHSYTNDQNVLDGPHRDLRRARNAATNIIPTSTVSMIYLVAQTKRPTTKEQLNALLRRAAEGELSKYVAYTEEELVSSDYKKNPNSSIIDGKLTGANGDLLQIAAWYDNEWGYSCRLAELTALVGSTIPAAT
jgi:glyceraldehyde 3-phosphate dehydrogenase